MNPVNELAELPPEAEVTEEVKVDYDSRPPVDDWPTDEHSHNNLLDVEKQVHLPTLDYKVGNQNEEIKSNA